MFAGAMTAKWGINGRFQSQTMSGVQRVAAAYAARLSISSVLLKPELPLGGLKAHAWEQIVLPRLGQGMPLWSPCNTGPVAVSHQVVTMHDAAVFDHPEWFSYGFAALYKLVMPALARRCRKIVTVSSFSRTRLAENFGVSPKKIDVIWNGVDESYAPKSFEEVAFAKRAVGLGEGRYFVCLSTLEPRKNTNLVMQAWSRARGHLPADMELLVIGKQGSPAVFRASSTTAVIEQNIRYAGYVEERFLPSLLSGAEALLYPSLYEGFGLPIAEAMACGTPAITTNRSSLPEIAGKAAIYVDAFDPNDMAAQIIRLSQSDDFRAEFSSLGLSRAKLFSWSDAARRMDEIMGQVG